LAQCIKKLVEDSHLAMSLAQNTYGDYESQFRFEDMFKGYLDLYENTCSFE